MHHGDPRTRLHCDHEACHTPLGEAAHLGDTALLSCRICHSLYRWTTTAAGQAVYFIGGPCDYCGRLTTDGSPCDPWCGPAAANSVPLGEEGIV